MATDLASAAASIRPVPREGRGDLLTEAVQLLSTLGIHGMSIGKLAQRSGYSKGGIMAHFTSKRAMILTLVEESVEVDSEEFSRVMAEAEGGQAAESRD